jgi:hypothetical protein
MRGNYQGKHKGVVEKEGTKTRKKKMTRTGSREKLRKVKEYIRKKEKRSRSLKPGETVR